MDKIYRPQKYIYDVTRKYYLFGRDTLLDSMPVRSGERILEAGCGTGRNIVKLASAHPNAKFYGFDASEEMLSMARAQSARRGLGDRVTLTRALAEEMDHQKTFGLKEPFDRIFFSYSLSMIPPWREALDQALNNLKPGGVLYVVDFCDFGRWPGFFGGLMRFWLKSFHVEYRREHIEHLRRRAAAGDGRLKERYLGGRYSYIATFEKVTT